MRDLKRDVLSVKPEVIDIDPVKPLTKLLVSEAVRDNEPVRDLKYE